MDAPAVPGLYVAGWLKRGPSGIIGSNIGDAREAAAAVLADANAGAGRLAGDAGGADALLKVIYAKEGAAGAGSGAQVVDWGGYHRMEEAEVAEGEGRSKPREKLVSVTSMLAVAQG